MTTISLTGSRTMPRGRRAADFGALVRQHLARAWHNYTSRRDLAGLDERMLQDLGISRAQAHFEANRPIWR
jgi:uncharacterized protein YjiS (DUF1127 family)